MKETPESSVRQIFTIIDPKGGSMGNQYIQPLPAADLMAEFPYTVPHLPLRILEFSLMILH